MTLRATETAPVEDTILVKIDEKPDSEEIRVWLVNYLADLLEVDQDEIDTSVSFDQYGLDSSTAVGITGDLSDWLSQDLDPVLLYDHPTIDALVQHLDTELR